MPPPLQIAIARHHITNTDHHSISFSTFTKSEYIHPLSQIVLEHLQSHHSHWVNRMGLDAGLKLNKDGTFTLRFPPNPDAGGVEATDVETAKDGSPRAVPESIW